MRRTFSFSSCYFGVVVSLPPVVFLQCFPGFVRYILLLCNVLVMVSSVFSCFVFFLFCALRCFQCNCPASSLVPLGLFQSFSGSAPLLRTPLRLPVLFLLLSGPDISFPPHGFPSTVLGLDSVLGVALTPLVPAVAPPLFCPFVSAPRFPHTAVPAVPSSLPLRFYACCGYGYGCSFQSSSAFPPAAAPAAPSNLPPCFPHAAAPAAPFTFGAAPAVFLAEGSPVAASGSSCCASLSLCLFPIDGLLPNAFVYHRFVSSCCSLSLGVSSSSCLFEVFFALASVPPQPVCLALFCVILIVPRCF